MISVIFIFIVYYYQHYHCCSFVVITITHYASCNFFLVVKHMGFSVQDSLPLLATVTVIASTTLATDIVELGHRESDNSLDILDTLDYTLCSCIVKIHLLHFIWLLSASHIIQTIKLSLNFTTMNSNRVPEYIVHKQY